MTRLLVLARELSRAGARGVPLKRIAERTGFSLRALYRDLNVLEDAGYPVVHENQRYRLIDGWAGGDALGIDAEELAAVFTARDLARGIKATTVGRSLDRLWAKLTSLDRRQAALVPERTPWFSVRSGFGVDYELHRNTIGALEHGIRDKLVVRAIYQARGAGGKGSQTTRDVEPVQLHWDPALASLYLLGYCRLRQALRVFAVHRFRAVEVLDSAFTPRRGVTSRESLRNAFRVWRGGQIRRVVIRFDPSAAEYIRERRWHPTQQMIDHRDGGLEMSLEVAGFEEIERWLLSFGAGAHVLEPAELRERIDSEHRRCLERAHEGPIQPSRAKPARAKKPGRAVTKAARTLAEPRAERPPRARQAVRSPRGG